MAFRLDAVDRKILTELQADAGRPLDEIAQIVGASKTATWNRIRKLRQAGVIVRQTVVVDPDKLGLGACFFVLIRTAEHEKSWQDRFLAVIRKRREVLEAHRLAGDIDYLLKVRVANAKAYDAFYQSLIAEVRLFNVTSALSMQEIKNEEVDLYVGESTD